MHVNFVFPERERHPWSQYNKTASKHSRLLLWGQIEVKTFAPLQVQRLPSFLSNEQAAFQEAIPLPCPCPPGPLPPLQPSRLPSTESHVLWQILSSALTQLTFPRSLRATQFSNSLQGTMGHMWHHNHTLHSLQARAVMEVAQKAAAAADQAGPQGWSEAFLSFRKPEKFLSLMLSGVIIFIPWYQPPGLSLCGPRVGAVQTVWLRAFKRNEASMRSPKAHLIAVQKEKKEHRGGSTFIRNIHFRVVFGGRSTTSAVFRGPGSWFQKCRVKGTCLDTDINIFWFGVYPLQQKFWKENFSF